MEAESWVGWCAAVTRKDLGPRVGRLGPKGKGEVGSRLLGEGNLAVVEAVDDGEGLDVDVLVAQELAACLEALLN